MTELAQGKQISIIVEVERDLFVSADEEQLQLILRNLVHNAIKFSMPMGSVVVTASKNAGYCIISVKDSGLGMNEDEIRTITGSAIHFSKVGTQQEKGTGLGLLLCKEFIKLNGGELTIRSKVNEWTEVVFTVPLAAPLMQPLSPSYS